MRIARDGFGVRTVQASLYVWVMRDGLDRRPIRDGSVAEYRTLDARDRYETRATVSMGER